MNKSMKELMSRKYNEKIGLKGNLYLRSLIPWCQVVCRWGRDRAISLELEKEKELAFDIVPPVLLRGDRV